MRPPGTRLPSRLRQRVVAGVKALPPGPRRVVRRAVDRWTGGSDAGPVAPRSVRRLPAEPVIAFDAWAMLETLAEHVRAALLVSGVEFACFERQGRTLVVVPAESRVQALEALRATPAARTWWVCGPGQRPERMADLAAEECRGEVLSIFRILAAPGGARLAGPELSLELQFWTTLDTPAPRRDGGVHAVGTRIAPVANTEAAYLAPAVWAEAAAHPRHRVRPAAPPHLLDLTAPVDAVYCWVDDSDPDWRWRRASVSPPQAQLAADALDPARTTSRDELRYSLRSLAMYANWIRHIWLVTDGQVPSWLRDHPRLTVVSHREIFSDPTVLPVFNSHAIESQLHHIRGLSEHYLYLNDDVFFGRPVRPELFFHSNGIAKFATSPRAIDREIDPGRLNGAMLAARRNREFLERNLGRTVTHRMQHAPHPHLRSSLQALEDAHPELVETVARSRFRSETDFSVASDLGHYWAFGRGEAVTAKFSYDYVDIGSARAQEQFESLLSRRDRDCFCINDIGGYRRPVDGHAVTRFLRSYFPVPSPFEEVGGTDESDQAGS